MRAAFLAFLLLALTVVHAQAPQKGDDLAEHFSRFPSAYAFDAPAFSSWAEGKEVILMGIAPDLDNNEFLFMATAERIPFGVFVRAATDYFLLDTDGDRKIDVQSVHMWIPAWTIRRKTQIAATDKTVYNLFDKLYQSMLQADDGAIDGATAAQFERYKTDMKLPNRHLVYLLDSYQELVARAQDRKQRPPAELCMPIIAQLGKEFDALYGGVPPLVNIYFGEALLSARYEDNARKHFKMVLEYFPESVPAQVYDYRLETDAAQKKAKLEKLKQEHPAHWMVKGL